MKIEYIYVQILEGIANLQLNYSIRKQSWNNHPRLMYMPQQVNSLAPDTHSVKCVGPNRMHIDQQKIKISVCGCLF